LKQKFFIECFASCWSLPAMTLSLKEHQVLPQMDSKNLSSDF
jgi:hypothetical protein